MWYCVVCLASDNDDDSQVCETCGEYRRITHRDYGTMPTKEFVIAVTSTNNKQGVESVLTEVIRGLEERIRELEHPNPPSRPDHSMTIYSKQASPDDPQPFFGDEHE